MTYWTVSGTFVCWTSVLYCTPPQDWKSRLNEQISHGRLDSVPERIDGAIFALRPISAVLRGDRWSAATRKHAIEAGCSWPARAERGADAQQVGAVRPVRDCTCAVHTQTSTGQNQPKISTWRRESRVLAPLATSSLPTPCHCPHSLAPH